MMLYPSRYTLSYPKGDKTLLFNTKTLFLGRVNSSDYQQALALVEKINQSSSKVHVSDEIKKVAFQLRQRGFFVTDQDEERQQIIERFDKQKSEHTHLGLTIAPTESCNFACPYCYENVNPAVMTKQMQMHVVDVIRSQLSNGRLKSMHITWYGGEPLMPKSLRAIESMSEKIIELCRSYGIHYSANVITNGYLLTKEVSIRLAQCKVELAQITLDGPKEQHNKTRILKNGKGSFDKIINNIRAGKPYLRFSIRMNVDSRNADSVAELKQYLKDEKILDDAGRVAFYISPVRSYTTSCKSSQCLSNHEFYQLQFELLKNGINDDGFSVVEEYPKSKESVCTAVGQDSFVIGPDGTLYKCWLDLGRPELTVGMINENGINLNKGMERWLSFSPFKTSGCYECTMLPVCMGGCPELNMRSSETEDNQACCGWKYVLEEHLEYRASKY